MTVWMDHEGPSSPAAPTSIREDGADNLRDFTRARDLKRRDRIRLEIRAHTARARYLDTLDAALDKARRPT